MCDALLGRDNFKLQSSRSRSDYEPVVSVRTSRKKGKVSYSYVDDHNRLTYESVTTREPNFEAVLRDKSRG